MAKGGGVSWLAPGDLPRGKIRKALLFQVLRAVQGTGFYRSCSPSMKTDSWTSGQASLNAMRQRFGAIFGQDNVALQHSRALQALYRQLLEKDYNPRHAQLLASREIQLGRLHVAPIRPPLRHCSKDSDG